MSFLFVVPASAGMERRPISKGQLQAILNVERSFFPRSRFGFPKIKNDISCSALKITVNGSKKT